MASKRKKNKKIKKNNLCSLRVRIGKVRIFGIGGVGDRSCWSVADLIEIEKYEIQERES